MRKPDFVIIGGMKCGTSTLAHQLGLQPGIFMTEPKEPNFFSDDDTFARGVDWYASLFVGAESNDLLGEASTHYSKWPTHPQAAERLLAFAPDVKLIYMVRDPVKRSVSQLRHHWTMREVEGSNFEQLALTHEPLWEYSRYDQQLAQWLAYVPEERILVTSLEAMEADPHAVFGRVLRFLNAEGQWQEGSEEQNVGADRSRRLPFHDILVDSPVATSLRRALVPKGFRNWVRNSRKLPSFEVSDEARAFLADRVRDDIARFGARFGIDDLTPENFAERVRERPLTFAGK